MAEHRSRSSVALSLVGFATSGCPGFRGCRRRRVRSRLSSPDSRDLRRRADADPRPGPHAGRLRCQRRLDRRRRADSREYRAPETPGREGLRRVQYDARRILPQGAPRRGPGGNGRQTLPGTRRLAGGLPDPSRVPQVEDGGVPKSPPGLRGQRRLARLPSRPCELGASRAESARHVLLRPLPGPVLARDGRETPEWSDLRTGWTVARHSEDRLGPMAVRRIHRLGARTPRDPRRGATGARCSGRSIARGRRTTSTEHCGPSWPST